MKKKGTFLLGFGLLSVLFMGLCVMCLAIDYDNSDVTASAATVNERYVIVIDPGHGGEDGGCVSQSGILEKDINLAIANKLSNILTASGYDVLMTRQEDTMLYDMYDDLADYKGKKKLFDLKNRIRFAKENV